MASAAEIRRRLRTLLEATEIVVAPGAGDPITARLAESLDFPAVHVSGSIAHRTSGYADAGILTLSEMVDRIAAMSAVVDLPLIADADTGFGGAVNVVRTMKEYERAGAAAVHIEDQLTPKRPTYQGIAGGFVTRQEMVDKIRAALDTRTDDNFMVIARCDVPDKQERTERLLACLDAGADVVWLSGQDVDDLRAHTQSFGGKLSLGVLPRGMTLQQYQDGGASCAVLPGILQIAALCAQRSLLEELKVTGTAQGYLSRQPFIEEMTRFYSEQGNAELKRIEAQYGGAQADPA